MWVKRPATPLEKIRDRATAFFSNAWNREFNTLFLEFKFIRTFVILWAIFWVTLLGTGVFVLFHFLHKYW